MPSRLAIRRGQAAVGVAQDQQPVGPLLVKDLLAAGQDLADLVAKTGGRDAQVVIRSAHASVREEQLAERSSIVLAGMDQHVVAAVRPASG